jgi:hypothetical protein
MKYICLAGQHGLEIQMAYTCTMDKWWSCWDKVGMYSIAWTWLIWCKSMASADTSIQWLVLMPHYNSWCWYLDKMAGWRWYLDTMAGANSSIQWLMLKLQYNWYECFDAYFCQTVWPRCQLVLILLQYNGWADNTSIPWAGAVHWYDDFCSLFEWNVTSDGMRVEQYQYIMYG